MPDDAADAPAPDAPAPDAPAPDAPAPHAQAPDPDVDPAAAAAAALRRATRSTAPRRTSSGPSTAGTSGRGGPAGRDPQLVGQALEALLTERGWQGDTAIARLIARWPSVVGEDVAAHVTPVSFQDDILVLQAESTAWATQVRLLLADLRRVIDAEVGSGVVASISVVGPASPSWVKGPRTVKGRGPRDTYG